MTLNPERQPVQRRSGYAAPLITMGCAFLLAGGSCFGFLATLNMNRSTPTNNFFAAGFGLCVLVFLGSVVWTVVKAILGRHGDRGPTQ
jgi:hypothetical protein